MFVDKYTNVTKKSRVEGIASVTSFLVVFLMLCLFFPLPGNADGLFDFQMKLAKGGNAEAQYKVGEMYETGFGVKQDQKEAMSWITKSANQGHETAGFKLLYWDVQKNGLKGDNKAKVESLKNKANAGNPQAQYYVGKMNAYGVGTKKNPDKAIEWFNKAALVGVLEAEREMTTIRENQQVQASRAKKEKEKAQLKAKQERDKQAKLEQQRKLKAKKDADAKARADAAAKQKKAKADAQAKANKEKSYQAKLAAKRDAEARQRKADEQAMLKKQAEEEKQRKTEFESDPCSGKSARFLSTCR